jgi:hypothetical protein
MKRKFKSLATKDSSELQSSLYKKRVQIAFEGDKDDDLPLKRMLD